MRRAIWTMLGTVVIIAAVVGWFLIDKRLEQNPPGFCVAQQRAIPDSEFVRTAVALYEWDMNRSSRVYPSGKLIRRRDDPGTGYDVWEKFGRSDPECCHVYRQDTKSVFARLFDSQEIEVDIIPDQERRGDGGVPFTFSVCGDVLPHDFGFHPPIRTITTRNYQELTVIK